MTFLPENTLDLWQAIFGGLLAYIVLLCMVRLIGLRSFAKMASHDFAVTVALGSVLAGAMMASKTAIAVPVVAIIVLFVLQFCISTLLARTDWAAKILSNQPLLLMENQTIFHDNLKAAKVSEDELRSKLREANVICLSQVKAVVFEATGDVSVLHGSGDVALEDYLLTNVQRKAG